MIGDILRDNGKSRYHRQTLVEWWDQDCLSRARVLVVGAGALGNEILKLLALMGAANVLIYDMDHVERSNLSRAVLFRDEDEGAPKAEVAALRMRSLNPDVKATARIEDIATRGGLGIFAWADVVIGGVDNREARIFINSSCARTGRAWIDGAIEGFRGVARVFDPVSGPCYECTMNETDRKLVAERRSCAMLARDIVEQGHVPTTAVAASIVAAWQVHEAMKILHGRPALTGEGLHFDDIANDVSRVRYQKREGCQGHDRMGPIIPLGLGTADVTLAALLERAEHELGGEVTLDFSRDVVRELSCPECGQSEPGRAVVGSVRTRQALCPRCGTHRIVEIASSASRDGDVDLSLTPADLGLPAFDIITARRGLEDRRAWLFDGDAGSVLGALATGGAS